MPRISPDARRALVEQRREQILKAAIHVFGEKGYERATIAEIARRAGVAEGSIYNYFKNKGDLLVSIPGRIVQPPIQAIAPLLAQSAVPGAVPPDQVLTAIARNIVGVFHQNSQVFRILLSAMPHLRQSARESYVEQVVRYATKALEAYFKKQIELGIFRGDLDPEVLAISFFGMLFPYIMLRELMQVDVAFSADYAQVIRQVVPLFLNGVMAGRGEGKNK